MRNTKHQTPSSNGAHPGTAFGGLVAKRLECGQLAAAFRRPWGAQKRQEAVRTPNAASGSVLAQPNHASRSASGPSHAYSGAFGIILSLLLLFPWPSGAAPAPAPLLHVHAHNDYEHTHPLLDALACGFCSVEADVHLVNGALLVAHSRSATKPGRTLQSLYLDPLRERVRQNGGHVFAGCTEFALLVDLKGKWQTLYPALRQVLERYSDILTSYQEGKKHTGAVTVIISGSRSPQMFAGEKVRYAAIDGQLPDLNSAAPADLIPWISSPWFKSFTWRGRGPMPESERAKLQAILAKAHQQGRRVRFWDAPDQPAFWAELLADKVDLINTDDLTGVRDFLAKQ